MGYGRLHSADVVSLLRVVASPVLPWVVDRPAVFVAVVAGCAASDVLDGMIARHTGTASPRGARLDSAADVVMFTSLVIAGLRGAGSLLAPLLPAGIAVAAFRLLPVAVAAVRYRRLVLLHTWVNKTSGGLLLVGVPVAVVADRVDVLVLAAVAVAVAGAEELVLHLTSPEPDLDGTGLLGRRTGGS